MKDVGGLVAVGLCGTRRHADERIIRAGVADGFGACNAMGGKERNGKARRDRKFGDSVRIQCKVNAIPG
jgi:hypothetical protein